MLHSVELFLQQVVDDPSAVLAKVGEHEADVHPVRPLRIVLHDELVEWKVVFDIVEPPTALLHIAVDTQVSGLAFHVLAIIHTANGFVQLFAAVAGADLYGFVHSDPKRFQNVGAEIDEIYHLLNAGLVINAQSFCCI